MRLPARVRLPVRLRQHWKLLAAAGTFVLLFGVVFGNDRARPLVLADTAQAVDPVDENIAGTVDAFDRSVAHRLSITFPDADYQRMLASFSAGGSKEFIKADLVIDGTPVPEVGLRLKGNSTLRSLLGPGRGFGGVRLSTEEPEDLPWLISFDEYDDGRLYQGREEIAVRPGGALLAEALALDLVGLAGEPTQRYAYFSVRVNDRPVSTRLLIENPDDRYADELGGDGVLYKGLSGGQFAYRGEDPLAYRQDFDQVNRGGSQDLQPLIDFIHWVSAATDAQFTAGLAERLDIESFARYCALQNLLLNFDDMAGPGRNYYLWYDLDRRRFTVITWDLNLALTGDPAQGPFEQGRFGGFPGGGVRPGGNQGGNGNPPGGGGNIPGGGFRTGHPLKERFLAAPAFRAEYQKQYKALYHKLFGSGLALRTLDRVTADLRGAGYAGPTPIESAAQQLRELINKRTLSLATDPVVAG